MIARNLMRSSRPRRGVRRAFAVPRRLHLPPAQGKARDSSTGSAAQERWRNAGRATYAGLFLARSAFPREATTDGILTVTGTHRPRTSPGCAGWRPPLCCSARPCAAAFDEPTSRTRVLTRGRGGRCGRGAAARRRQVRGGLPGRGQATVSVMIRGRLIPRRRHADRRAQLRRARSPPAPTGSAPSCPPSTPQPARRWDRSSPGPTRASTPILPRRRRGDFDQQQHHQRQR